MTFIFDVRFSRYPDQAGVTSGRSLPQRGDIDGTPCDGDAKNDDDDDDDDDDDGDDEEDYDDEMPVLHNGAGYNRDKKRGSICAEIVQENQDDIKEFEKKPDERMRILEILESSNVSLIVGSTTALKIIRILLRQQILFRHLEKEQREFVARAMFIMEFKSGDTIITQGDDGGNFYIIDSGNVECFKYEDSLENEKLVHTYSPGGAFGELAIMYNAPRAATCRAISDCRLYALERKVYLL